MDMNIKVKKLHPNAKMPFYGTEFSAGADLCACLDEPVTLQPNETRMISIGIAVELPVGYAGLIFARSGLASRRDLAPANKVGVVDCDYRGEWFVPMHNHGLEPQTIEPGERIAQLVITPYLTAKFVENENLSETVRGSGGFGSTGVK
ncbi:MAG: dUTP diphosphatase [Ruminococcaceae bacterium]|nr:dUTP diphosphatase [Oscillospiraceae bacterium]